MIRRYKRRRRFRSGKAYLDYQERLYSRLSAWRRLKVARLSEAQNHRCAYCCKKTHLGEPGLPKADRATLDHLIPVSKPVQTNKGENLVMACDECNNLRSNAAPHEYYNRIRRPPCETIRFKPLSKEKSEKMKRKKGYALALVLIIITFWPDAAQQVIDYSSTPRKIRLKKSSAQKLKDIQYRVRRDPRALAA